MFIPRLNGQKVDANGNLGIDLINGFTVNHRTSWYFDNAKLSDTNAYDVEHWRNWKLVEQRDKIV